MDEWQEIREVPNEVVEILLIGSKTRHCLMGRLVANRDSAFNSDDDDSGDGDDDDDDDA